MTTTEALKIGQRIKEFRLINEMRLYDVAEKAGISKGLLSRIENNRAIPSVPVMISIIKALNTNLENFFEGIDDMGTSFYIHCSKSYYTALKKEDSIGFNYFNITNQVFYNIGFQATILHLEPNAYREKVTTEGFEFLFILKGNLEYHLDKDCIQLQEGDSLFFNGRIPHVPKNNSHEMVSLLVIYLITNN